jgi:hypothetical protein
VSTNVLRLQPQPGAVAPDRREPLADAVSEISGRVRSLNGERRRHYSRLDELESGDPSLRRASTRSLPLDPHRPLTIYSIEEASASPLQEARRG